ncbi:hypothetical protein lerEdw1_009736 [Lerista edwardsae]|nr:hypothetical protein lerEdw1_009736 [Lerista edwardsae]
MFSVVSYCFILVLGTIRNGLVIFITGFRMKETVNTIWILNLAIADFNFSIFLLFHIAYRAHNFHWPFGRITCKLIHSLDSFHLFASVYLLVVISFDHCIAVCCPVRAQNPAGFLCGCGRLDPGFWLLVSKFVKKENGNQGESSPNRMTYTTITTQLANANNYMNNSDSGNYEDKNWLRKLDMVPVVIYSLAFVLGVTGNGLVIFITGFRMKKTVNTVWFLNLAIADFIFTFFLPLSITYIALKYHWPFGLAMCKINSTIALLNMYASVYLLMVISIDRCISVRLPVWAQNHRSPRLASFVALGVWILSLMLSSPNLYFRQTKTSYDVTYCHDHYSSEPEQHTIIHFAMINFRFTFAFVIPFGVILCSYVAVVLKLRRSRLSPSNKPFKVITAVIVAFFICWLPYHIFSFLDTKPSKSQTLRWVVYAGVPLASSLAFLNSCLNPILYVFMGHDFKEQLRRSLLSTFENAFTEQSNVNTTNTKSSSVHELETLKV